MYSEIASANVFYCDLKGFGKPYFSDQFKKIIKRYEKVGYNMDIIQLSACLVVKPITAYSYGFHFNCMMVGKA